MALKSQTIDPGDDNKIATRERQLDIIERALKCPSMKEAIQVCAPLLLSENDKKPVPLKMKLRNVPGTLALASVYSSMALLVSLIPINHIVLVNSNQNMLFSNTFTMLFKYLPCCLNNYERHPRFTTGFNRWLTQYEWYKPSHY